MRTLARRHGGELARFLVVGAFSALCNTLIVVALTEFGHLPYTLSYWVCFAIVTLWGFLLNRTWSFRGNAGSPRRQQALRYYLVTLAGTIIAFGFVRLLVSAGLPYWLACYLAAGLLAPFNFVAHRQWSFRIGSPDQSS